MSVDHRRTIVHVRQTLEDLRRIATAPEGDPEQRISILRNMIDDLDRDLVALLAALPPLEPLDR